MQRGGSTHHPHYRVVVTDVRTPRDGRFVERVGTYDPKNKKESEQINLKLDRIDYWLGVGAQPSDTVRSLIKRARKAAPAEAEASVKEDAPAVEPEAAPAETASE
jgi:small subunit ribosomal protein S16